MNPPEIAAYNPDVVVVGAGNAALCAALSAHEQGAKVLILEAAPYEERGGNSHYTGGAFRFAYNGVEDLKEVCPSMTDEELENVDFGTYTEGQFFDDMFELTEFRTDPDLCELLVHSSLDTAKWMAKQGVKLQPGLGRQAFKVDGKFKFWGGLALHIWGGGEELLKALYKKADDYGIPIAFQTPAESLIRDDDGDVVGIVARQGGKRLDIYARAIILACGGFESNPEMRAKYLGPGWDAAKVRGTSFNMGMGLQMALDVGARPFGNWSGCHSVAWDVNAPAYGDLTVGDQFQKHNYPFGILVNAKGERYVDEGANFHSHTYAKYGGEILKQPGMFAWQIFDDKVTDLLRGEYRIRRVTKVEADTLEELAEQLEGVDPKAFLKTVHEYNEACRTEVPFNPNIRDGRCTEGLAINKSNWANPLDTPPFHAYHVTTGVTFTFGGLKVSQNSEVEGLAGEKIPGLYAAGEIVGGLFYNNYASGTGLMSGATFGRLAGKHAAQRAKA
ncbi:FAD-dependent tricarballylate dehydrogenase TcuA [Halomonas salipaludis]|uniref:Tricarballylate dehydrogenase n=1 Tax=Halomonas salipaludis TaxID=2032625 RepID=A0A2A2ET35_9GAMM|nr:FAD-dependent tricarballylate dehydrogenase TcuA [Halomonas salipaludis]PAU75575.1 tricarballylate dehydrogenase [Halomonas salipaludis]